MSSVYTLLILLSMASVFLLKTTDAEVLVLTPANFDKVVGGNENVLLEFYAPWCGHCKSLAPTYDKLGAAWEDSDAVTIAKIDCDAHNSLCQKHKIEGFPTIKHFKAGSKTGEEYMGDLTVEGMSDYLKKQGGKGGSAPSTRGGGGAITFEGDVAILTNDNFKDAIATGDWLVEYYAPWCGHCKSLAPAYAEAATALKGKLNLAKVDATVEKTISEDAGVSGFPTIKLYKNGSFVEDFDGQRTAEGFTEYAAKVPELKIPVAGESMVVDLTDSDFADKTASGIWLVEFYAPWCGHCKSLKPIWEAVANKITPLGINVAKVDSTANNALTKKYGISGFPTIKLFKDGKFRGTHNGGRAVTDFENYAMSANSPTFSTITDLSEATAKVGFMLIHGENDATEVSTFEELADENFVLDSVNFYKTTNKQIAEELKIEKIPALVQVVGDEREVYAGDLTKLSEMQKFFNQYKTPLFPQAIPSENFREILYSGKRAVVANVWGESENEDYLAWMKELAASYKGEYQFCWMDVSVDKDMLSEIGLSKKDLPQFIVFDGDKIEYYLDKKVNDAASAKVFLKKVSSGKMKGKKPGKADKGAAKDEDEEPAEKKGNAAGSASIDTTPILNAIKENHKKRAEEHTAALLEIRQLRFMLDDHGSQIKRLGGDEPATPKVKKSFFNRLTDLLAGKDAAPAALFGFAAFVLGLFFGKFLSSGRRVSDFEMSVKKKN